MSTPFDSIEDQIQRLIQKAGELDAKIQGQNQTIYFLCIIIGVLAVVSVLAFGLAIWTSHVQDQKRKHDKSRIP
jgi:nitrate reductase NapE component